VKRVRIRFHLPERVAVAIVDRDHIDRLARGVDPFERFARRVRHPEDARRANREEMDLIVRNLQRRVVVRAAIVRPGHAGEGERFERSTLAVVAQLRCRTPVQVGPNHVRVIGQFVVEQVAAQRKDLRRRQKCALRFARHRPANAIDDGP